MYTCGIYICIILFLVIYYRGIEVKRTICKGCRSLLLPGITSKVRIKKKKVIHHCLICRTRKVFITKNKNYTPWTMKSESLAEILEYNLIKMKNEGKQQYTEKCQKL